MKDESTCIPVRKFVRTQFVSSELEFVRLQTALMQLEDELLKTVELIQNIKDYIQENHIIPFPLPVCSHRQPVMVIR